MPRIKPRQPVYRPDKLPGVSFLADFSEGAGYPRVRINGVRQLGTVVGSPTWTTSPYGPALTSLSPSSYVDYPAIYSNDTRWQACLFTNTSTAQSTPYAWASTANDFTFDEVVLNFGGAGTVDWFIREDVGSLLGPAAITVPCDDGLPHVVMTTFNGTGGLGDYSLYWDGSLGSTVRVASPHTITPTQLSLGVSHRGAGGVGSSFPGNLIALAYGVGQIPDPWRLYQDWITGAFGAFRRPRRPRGRFNVPASAAVLFRRNLYVRAGSRGIA